jgi:hypothetical protein
MCANPAVTSTYLLVAALNIELSCLLSSVLVFVYPHNFNHFIRLNKDFLTNK